LNSHSNRIAVSGTSLLNNSLLMSMASRPKQRFDTVCLNSATHAVPAKS
jgi:hypothetical protein